MKFVTVRVFYVYPLARDPHQRFYKDYTVQENEPFVENAAFKQWQRDKSLPHGMITYNGSEIIQQEPNAPIVQLPLGFCETKYPGYFWDFNGKKLYSLKSGMLKEIPRRKWNGNKNYRATDGYAVSHLGKRKHLPHETMMSLVPSNVVIPLKPVPKQFGSRWS